MCRVFFVWLKSGILFFLEASGKTIQNSFWMVLSLWSVSSLTTVSQSVRTKNINGCQTSFSISHKNKKNQKKLIQV